MIAMVKGTIVGKPSRDGTPNDSKGSGRRSAAKKPAATVDQNLPSCTGCGSVITPDTRALCCDRCMNDEAWKCIDCLDMTKEIYDALTTSAAACMKWFCEDCDKAVASFKDDGKEDKTGDILKMLEQLVDGTKAVEHRLDSIEHTLDDKASVKQVQELEGRLRSVEVKIEAADNVVPLGQRLQKLEESAGDVEVLKNRMHQLEGSSKCLTETVQTVQQASIWSDMKVKDCIEKVVEARCVEDTVEKDEKEKRKTSVIIHGVAESNSAEAKEREEDDFGVMASMLHEIKCDEVQVKNVIRLGRRSLSTNTDEQIKPQPIKMVLETEEQKIKVLKAAKNLRWAKEGAWGKIFVHQDLTLKEREERKILLQEKKDREQNGETDLILVGNRIVKRYGSRQKQEQGQITASTADEETTV